MLLLLLNYEVIAEEHIWCSFIAIRMKNRSSRKSSIQYGALRLVQVIFFSINGDHIVGWVTRFGSLYCFVEYREPDEAYGLHKQRGYKSKVGAFKEEQV